MKLDKQLNSAIISLFLKEIKKKANSFTKYTKWAFLPTSTAAKLAYSMVVLCTYRDHEGLPKNPT